MKITKEQEARILALDPNFFNLELQVNQWYKVTRNSEEVGKPAVVFFQGQGIETFGFCHDGTWINDYGDYNTFQNEFYIYDKVSDKEINKMLIKEAKKRGYDYRNYTCLLMPNHTHEVSNSFFVYENSVYQGREDEASNVVFKNGKWAETTETNKYYKTKFCFYKVSSKGFCVQVTTDEDYLSISKCDISFPFLIGVKITDVATKEEFDSAYNSVNNKLINLKYD